MVKQLRYIIPSIVDLYMDVQYVRYLKMAGPITCPNLDDTYTVILIPFDP